jgi:solute carrier family 35 protein C2
MQKSNMGLSNPIDMIFHIQPIMIVALLPFALGFEGATITRGLANIQVTYVYDWNYGWVGLKRR